ncbi:MAG: hypothetical protein M9913_17025 [Bryobacteraceae bacterium]|nr:hypothetical protein [Solibacteraceae bacterium]MCO5352570.1 hypothetical protein [Bryobacteraceae bacterium]
MTNATKARTTKGSADRTTSRLQDIAESVGFPRTEQHSDRLDFHELHINTLMDVLRQAYEMGRADERKTRRA